MEAEIEAEIEAENANANAKQNGLLNDLQHLYIVSHTLNGRWLGGLLG